MTAPATALPATTLPTTINPTTINPATTNSPTATTATTTPAASTSAGSGEGAYQNGWLSSPVGGQRVSASAIDTSSPAAASAASIANRVAAEAIPARNAVRIEALVASTGRATAGSSTAGSSTAGRVTAASPTGDADTLTGAADGPAAARPMTLDALPGRDLDQRELLELAASIAADSAGLERHIAFSDDRRHYVSLHRDTHVDVWLLCWTPQNDTGWHDHDISSGAVAVLRGALTEHNLAIGTPSIETEIGAGSAFSFGPDHIHRLTGRDAGSVSVHAYSPPLWRMGQYTLGSGGQLRRKSVSYADELRPLDDMA